MGEHCGHQQNSATPSRGPLPSRRAFPRLQRWLDKARADRALSWRRPEAVEASCFEIPAQPPTPERSSTSGLQEGVRAGRNVGEDFGGAGHQDLKAKIAAYTPTPSCSTGCLVVFKVGSRSYGHEPCTRHLAFGSGEDEVPDVGVVHLRVHYGVACRPAFLHGAVACDPNLCAAARVEQRSTTVAEAGAFPFLAGSDLEARQVLWVLRLIGPFGARVRNHGDRHFVHAFRQDVGALFRYSPAGGRQDVSGFLQIVLFCGCELDRLDALYRTHELQDRSIVSIPIVARMDEGPTGSYLLAPVLLP